MIFQKKKKRSDPVSSLKLLSQITPLLAWILSDRLSVFGEETRIMSAELEQCKSFRWIQVICFWTKCAFVLLGTRYLRLQQTYWLKKRCWVGTLSYPIRWWCICFRSWSSTVTMWSPLRWKLLFIYQNQEFALCTLYLEDGKKVRNSLAFWKNEQVTP